MTKLERIVKMNEEVDEAMNDCLFESENKTIRLGFTRKGKIQVVMITEAGKIDRVFNLREAEILRDSLIAFLKWNALDD